MNTNKSTLFLLLSFAVLGLMTTSCVTSKKVRYLQDMPKYGLPINKALEPTIAPFDELRIHVLSNTSKGEELLKPFNAMQAIGQQSGGGGNDMGYLVDAYGNIQFPVLGEIHVEGLTRLQLQDTIAARLVRDDYLKDPLVTARFLNFKVFFLSGNGGKVINVTNERCTFLEALAMAGGLDWYTRRDRIGVMREVDGKRVIHYLDPRSTAIFDDEFFLLQQNDIIFTEETSSRFTRESLSNWTFVLSTLTSLAAFATLWMSFQKK